MKKKRSAVKKKPSNYKQRLAVHQFLNLDSEHRQTFLARQKLFPSTEEAEQVSISLEEAGTDLLSTINAFEDELNAIETSPQVSSDEAPARLSWREAINNVLTGQEVPSNDLQSMMEKSELGSIDFEGMNAIGLEDLDRLLLQIQQLESSSISEEEVTSFVEEFMKIKDAAEGGDSLIYFGEFNARMDKLPKELETDTPIVMPVNLASKQMEDKILEKRKDKSVTFVPPPLSPKSN